MTTEPLFSLVGEITKRISFMQLHYALFDRTHATGEIAEIPQGLVPAFDRKSAVGSSVSSVSSASRVNSRVLIATDLARVVIVEIVSASTDAATYVQKCQQQGKAVSERKKSRTAKINNHLSKRLGGLQAGDAASAKELPLDEQSNAIALSKLEFEPLSNRQKDFVIQLYRGRKQWVTSHSKKKQDAEEVDNDLLGCKRERGVAEATPEATHTSVATVEEGNNLIASKTLS